jgi:hypothetical protein
MYNTGEEEFFSKTMGFVLRAFSITGIAGFAIMLFPQIRLFLITFVEDFIVHRDLVNRHWDNFFFIGSLVGIFLSVGFLAISYSPVMRFLVKNHTVSCCLLVLPVLFLFITITLVGVNIPYWDEWELVAFFDGIIKHGIKFQDFFAQHNEHRIFFPRLVFLVSVFLSHFNVKVNMYLSLFLLAAIYGCYLVYVRDTIICVASSEKLRRLFLALSLGFCCLNIAQHDNILWGFQVGFVMVAAFSVFCFYYFYRGCTSNKFRYFLVSAVAGFVASFSSLHGLFVFPVIIGVMFLLFISGETIPLKYVFFIILWTVFTYAIYFYDYSSPPGHQSHFMKSFLELILSFFAVLGTPFTFRFTALAVIAGILLFFFGILLTMFLTVKKRVGRYVFPLSLIFFGYAFCGAVAIGRSGMGVEGTLASRYATFSLFVFTGLVIIVYTEFHHVEKTEILKCIAVQGIRVLLIVLLSQYVFIGDLVNNVYASKTRQAQIIDYRNQTLDALRSSYPWTDIDSAYGQIGILEKNRWSVFYRGLSSRKE